MGLHRADGPVLLVVGGRLVLESAKNDQLLEVVACPGQVLRDGGTHLGEVRVAGRPEHPAHIRNVDRPAGDQLRHNQVRQRERWSPRCRVALGRRDRLLTPRAGESDEIELVPVLAPPAALQAPGQPALALPGPAGPRERLLGTGKRICACPPRIKFPRRMSEPGRRRRAAIEMRTWRTAARSIVMRPASAATPRPSIAVAKPCRGEQGWIVGLLCLMAATPGSW